MKIALEIEGIPIKLEERLELDMYNPNIPRDMCLPENLEEGKFYNFHIKGWNIFPLSKPINLFSKGETNQLASIDITEQTTFLLAGNVHTLGKYYTRKVAKNESMD